MQTSLINLTNEKGIEEMENKQQMELGTKSISKLLFSMAIPAITAQVINLLYNMIDRMYIGHIPEVGATALTAVGVTMPIIMVISAFAALVSMGGAPRSSIMMGKGDKDTAEKILLLSKIQNAQLQTSEIDINQNITNIIEDIKHQHNTLIECNINSKKSIQADPLLINIVWQNLISNSIKYAHPNRKLKINIETNIQDNEMIIDYTDNGIGINRTELNSAADTRDRIMNNNSNKIGLNIIQTIIEKHGGDFKIVDSSIHGSKFRITLP